MTGRSTASVVSVLKVNSLIATLGTMIAYRGIALSLTDALLVRFPNQFAFSAMRT